MFTVVNSRARLVVALRNAYEMVRPPRWMSFVNAIRCPWCGTYVPPREFPRTGPACRKCLRRKRNRATTDNRSHFRTRVRGGAR